MEARRNFLALAVPRASIAQRREQQVRLFARIVRSARIVRMWESLRPCHALVARSELITEGQEARRSQAVQIA